MNPQEIVNFIKYQLERGVNRIEIERVLKLNQVSSEAISQAFATVGAGAMTNNPPAAAAAPTISSQPTPASSATELNTPPPPAMAAMNKVPPPPAPITANPPSPAAATAVPKSSHHGLWLLGIILALILLGGGIFAYLKLSEPALITVEDTPPLSLPLATTTLNAETTNPQQLLLKFKDQLASSTHLEYQFELSAVASTTKLGGLSLPASGTASLDWQTSPATGRKATLTLTTNASGTPLSISFPFSLPILTASSTAATPDFTASGIERVGTFTAQRYQFSLPDTASSTANLAQGSLWLDPDTALPRQIKLENSAFVLTLTTP